MRITHEQYSNLPIELQKYFIFIGSKKWEKPRGGIWKTEPETKEKLINNEIGRFPANIILDNSKEVEECFPDSDSGSASRFFFKAEWTDEDIKSIYYCSKASRKERGDFNNHVCVKPLKLMEYLCNLTKTPTGGIVLDPFAGSGSTLIAAKQEGFNFIGIEREKDYIEIAEARLKATPMPML